MPTSYKYLPYATAAVCTGGLGVGVYYAFYDRVYQKDAPGSDVKEDLAEFFRQLREWLEAQFPGTHPPSNPPGGEPGIPDPSTGPDSTVYQSSFSTSSPTENGSSIGQALTHVPMEAWALIAVVTFVIAMAYFYHQSQQQQKSPSPSRG